MTIRLQDLFEQEGGEVAVFFDETVDLNAGQAEEWPARLQGPIFFYPSGRCLTIRGRLQGEVNLECVRCLESFSQSVDFQFLESCVLANETAVIPTNEEDRWTEEGEFILSPDEPAPINEILRQHCLLHLPLYPLCREDCPGLWAEMESEAVEPSVDPRWAKLQSLVDQKE